MDKTNEAEESKNLFDSYVQKYSHIDFSKFDIQRSNTCFGFGVYAKVFIPKGKIVFDTLEFVELINDADFIYPKSHQQNDIAECFQNYLKIFKHGATKCNLKKVKNYIISTRDIQLDEELFIHYGIKKWFYNLLCDYTGKRWWTTSALTKEDQSEAVESISSIASIYGIEISVIDQENLKKDKCKLL